MNHKTAVDDMLADLDASDDDLAAVRAVLTGIAGLASEVPEPSDDVRALLGGAIPLRSHRRAAGGTSRSRGIVAAAVGAVAFSGVSAAAATNRLPDPIQEVVADAADGVLPAGVPHPAHPARPRHPVTPVNPPFDAPGHVRNKPKTTHAPKPVNTTAPGQIQKATKPDPGAPGPARPADPGSHGRAHNDATESADSDATDDDSALSDSDKTKDAKPDNGKGKGKGKGKGNDGKA
ncbi:MAG: hypothetical protein ACJ71Z_01975 [Aeromicrobium sp.]